MKQIDFWGISVTVLESRDLSGLIKQLLSGSSQWVVTLNAEMLLRARRQREYKHLLQQADFHIPDGYGLVLWSRHLIPERFPGIDLAEQVLTQAQEKNLRVLCLLSNTGLTQEADLRAYVTQQWPRLRVEIVTVDGQQLPDTQVQPEWKQADIVLVNFGVPQQDQWMAWWKKNMPSRVMMGIGGTFDYWTGQVSRSPRWLRRLGLESIWRLVQQPWRIGRVWNALVVFSWYALWHPPVASQNKP